MTILSHFFREINIEHTIDECKAHIQKLKSPTNGLEALPQQLLIKSLSSIEAKEKQLIKQRQELKDMWQKAEARIEKHTKGRKYKTKADKVLQEC